MSCLCLFHPSLCLRGHRLTGLLGKEQFASLELEIGMKLGEEPKERCAEGDAMAVVVGAVKEVELAAELTSSIIIIKSNMDPFTHCINYIIIIPFPFELQEPMELAHQGNNRCIEEQVKHGELPQDDLLACLRQPLELFIVEDSVTKLEIL